MRNLIFYSAFIISALAVGFVSCSDDKGDTEKPKINLISPANGDSLRIGADVHLDMELSDNDLLSSYRINIHSAEGHTHDTKSGESTVVFDRSWDLSGKKNEPVHHHEIIIPESAKEGEYHFMVYCLDVSGNQSYVVRSVILSHDAEVQPH